MHISISQQSVSLLIGWRKSLEQAGASHKCLLVAGDGRFCHRALFRTPLERTDLLCRTRALVHKSLLCGFFREDGRIGRGPLAEATPCPLPPTPHGTISSPKHDTE
jgi:hypothetical protein